VRNQPRTAADEISKTNTEETRIMEYCEVARHNAQLGIGVQLVMVRDKTGARRL